MPDTLKPCPKCEVIPERETKLEMLGTYRDGGYQVLHGRFVCPVCGFGQTWGQSYSVHYGWDANERMWNRLVDAYKNRRVKENDDGT